MTAYRDRFHSASVTVTSLSGSLQGQSQFIMGIEIAGWTFVSVTIDDFVATFWNNGRCRA